MAARGCLQAGQPCAPAMNLRLWVRHMALHTTPCKGTGRHNWACQVTMPCHCHAMPGHARPCMLHCMQPPAKDSAGDPANSGQLSKPPPGKHPGPPATALGPRMPAPKSSCPDPCRPPVQRSGSTESCLRPCALHPRPPRPTGPHAPAFCCAAGLQVVPINCVTLMHINMRAHDDWPALWVEGVPCQAHGIQLPCQAHVIQLPCKAHGIQHLLCLLSNSKAAPHGQTQAQHVLTCNQGG